MERRRDEIESREDRDEICILHGLHAAKAALDDLACELAGMLLARTCIDKAIAEQRIRLYPRTAAALLAAGVPLDRVSCLRFVGADAIEVTLEEDDLFVRPAPPSREG